ncbi:hypothetical protein RRG08_034560 [Elysia crispata]|uniref:Uncharacterized protein n=1 Tax=Elysia crispata TaxID=231223 RepID=A0AAE1E887_9GAST|nr:hypothetical protein RRG08_034560 [Elysia crispata]
MFTELLHPVGSLGTTTMFSTCDPMCLLALPENQRELRQRYEPDQDNLFMAQAASRWLSKASSLIVEITFFRDAQRYMRVIVPTWQWMLSYAAFNDRVHLGLILAFHCRVYKPN